MGGSQFPPEIYIIRRKIVSRHFGGRIKAPLEPPDITAVWYRGVLGEPAMGPLLYRGARASQEADDKEKPVLTGVCSLNTRLEEITSAVYSLKPPGNTLP